MKLIISTSILLLGLFLLQPQTAQAQLNESFEASFPPAGWAVFDNGVQQNQSWEQQDFNPNTGSRHAFANFSSSRTEFAEDWLVTPKLLPDAGNSSLTFFATDDDEGDFGSIYTVRISTISQTDPLDFTIEATYTEMDFTAGAYQQFTVDLSAYIGQEIYVAFVLENSRGDSFLLDDVSGPPAASAATPPNCDAFLTTPAFSSGNVGIDTDFEWLPASGDPTGYKLQIGTSPDGGEFLPLTDVGAATTYDPASDLAYNTLYYVTIIPYNAAGDADTEECELSFFTTEADPNILLDCAGTGISEIRTLCYRNNEVEEFTIASNSSDQVGIIFNAGTVENNQDELYIYDGVDDTGTLLNAGKLYGEAGELTGLSYVSTMGSLFVRLTPDGSNDCAGGDQTTIEFTASCASCTPAAATATVGTCDPDNSQFFIDVDFSFLGDGDVIISNDQNANTETVNTTGITTVGPFDFGTVVLTLENAFHAQCNVALPAVTVNGCPAANDECSAAIELTVSPDQNCVNAVSGTTAFSTESAAEGICTFGSLDVWYQFTPGSTDTYVFALSDVAGLMSVAVYEGDCAAGLTLLNEDCFNEGRATVDLIANETYLVQIFADDEFSAGSFNLCVFAAPAAPANDLCANATVISCPGETTLNNQDATFATDSDAAGCANDPIGQGVWYQFAGTDGLFTITVNPDEWDAEIQLWSGADCNNLTCEASVDEGVTGGVETITDFQMMPDLTYYLYVGAAASGDGAGLFDLIINCSGTGSATLVSPVVYLQGPYDPVTGLMGDALRTTGLVPLTEPYTDFGYTHIGGGGETTQQSVLDVSGPDAIVDWVFLELRDKSDQSVVVATRSALLQRDGNVVDTDGVSPVAFADVPADDYYLAIKHRNHLGAMTVAPVALSGTAVLVDLTSDVNQVTGGANGIVILLDGKLGLYSGDFNRNGQVQNTDYSSMVLTLGTAGYQAGDLDLNGQVQNTDLQLKLVPNIGRGQQFGQ